MTVFRGADFVALGARRPGRRRGESTIVHYPDFAWRPREGQAEPRPKLERTLVIIDVRRRVPETPGPQRNEPP